MGWELWQNKPILTDDGPYKDLCEIGFFCNTADTSFGPVIGFTVDSKKYKDAKDQIYSEWKAEDPRCLTDDEIRTEVERIQKETNNE